MNLRRRINILLIATLLGGCGLLVVGADFPSPAIDSGDLSWRWLYAKKYSGGEISKDLTVRFDAKGFVKSYSFSSNEPEDMARLK